jgi:hypothetical protein
MLKKILIFIKWYLISAVCVSFALLVLYWISYMVIYTAAPGGGPAAVILFSLFGAMAGLSYEGEKDNRGT